MSVQDDNPRIQRLCDACRRKLEQEDGLMDPHELCEGCYRIWEGEGPDWTHEELALAAEKSAEFGFALAALERHLAAGGENRSAARRRVIEQAVKEYRGGGIRVE